MKDVPQSWMAIALFSLLAGGPGCGHVRDKGAATPESPVVCPVPSPQSGKPYQALFTAEVQWAGFVVAAHSQWTLSRNLDATRTEIPRIDEVDAMVREIASAALPEPGRPIRYEQALNDCQHRAHLAAAHILSQRPGWLVGKVLVQGYKQLGMAHGKIRWGFHIAPVVVASSPKGGLPVLLVVDPAVDDTRGLPLSEWLMAIHRPRANSEPPTAAFLPADRWQQSDGSLTFCDELALARGMLDKSAAEQDSVRRFRGEFSRADLRVSKIDRVGHRVWFEGSKWFHYPQSAYETLKRSSERRDLVTIWYRKVPLRHKRHHYLHIHQVEAPVVPESPNLERKWDALGAEVTADVRNTVSESRATVLSQPQPPVAGCRTIEGLRRRRGCGMWPLVKDLVLVDSPPPCPAQEVTP